MHYHIFTIPDENLQINVHPYLLKEYNRRWYLLCAAEEDGKLLNFSLDRIDKCIPLTSHKYKEYDGDINERFDDIIGVTWLEDSPVYQIIFWVSDKSKDYVLTKPLHASQRTLPETTIIGLHDRYPSLEGGVFLRIDCKRNYELIRELTSFGENLLVIEPIVIQDEVYKQIVSLNDKYTKLRK